MKTYRVGLVGCGGIAQVHGAVLQELPGVELAACADIRPERARDFAEKYGGRAYASLEEMLEGEQLDSLHICTPHSPPHAHGQAGGGPGHPRVHGKAPGHPLGPVAGVPRAGKGPRAGGGVLSEPVQPERPPAERGAGLWRGRQGAGGRAFVTWHREAPYYTESGWRGSLETEGAGCSSTSPIHTLDLLVQFLGKPTHAEATMSNHHLGGVIEVRTQWRPTSGLERPRPCPTPPRPTARTPRCWWSWCARTPPCAWRSRRFPSPGRTAPRSTSAWPSPRPRPQGRPTGGPATACASGILRLPAGGQALPQ